MSWFDNVFGAKKKSVLDLPAAELDAERIRLEEEERRVLARLDKAEDEKKRLFRQGTGETSQRQKIVIARKIKEIDEQARELDSRAGMISKQMRIVNRLVSVQRNKTKLQESGVWSMISQMSAEDLDRVLTGQIVEGTMEREKVQALIDVIEADPRATRNLEEDEDVLNLVEQMEQASESGRIDETYEKANKNLDKKKEEESESF